MYLKERWNREFILYILIAVASAAVDFTIFSVLVFFVDFEAILCQGISRILGGVTSFALNKNITFNGGQGNIKVETRRFLLLYGVSYVLSLSLFGFWNKVLLIAPLIAKILSDSLCALFNFFAMKFYVYRNIKGFLAVTVGLIKRINQ